MSYNSKCNIDKYQSKGNITSKLIYTGKVLKNVLDFLLNCKLLIFFVFVDIKIWIWFDLWCFQFAPISCQSLIGWSMVQGGNLKWVWMSSPSKAVCNMGFLHSFRTVVVHAVKLWCCCLIIDKCTSYNIELFSLF